MFIRFLFLIVFVYSRTFLLKNGKIERDFMVVEDSIIIRVNLIRYIIFRNL